MSDATTQEGINGKVVVLGLQHTFVMFGATVLVPVLTGLDVGVTLFAAGIGTLIFHVITKFKMPVFLGSSFAFLPPIFAVAATHGGDLAYATGAIAIAGLVYLAVSLLFTFVSTEWLHKILPPHVTGPIIILIGLLLAPVAIGNITGNAAGGVMEQIGRNGAWLIAVITFATGVIVKVGFERMGWKFASQLPVLIALIVGYLVAIIAGVVDFGVVANRSWIGLPEFMAPKFSVTAIALTVPIAIVTVVEHFGDVVAIGNVVKKDYIADPGINRTLLGDGIATSVSALLGGPANTTYSENTGAVAFTGVYNPNVMRIAAVFAILLSIIPKFTGMIQTIPAPVIGGISILLFGMISSIGIRNMVEARVNMDDARILIIVAAILVIGLGGASFTAGETFELSGLGLAAVVGILLNLLINFKSFKRA
ncbi:MAG: uracil-xanthine permease family protein [Spirochaeta sp.]|jgi:uracil permease|nr:uracil-xanthine permease family protein [Spirochaeta sp.]